MRGEHSLKAPVVTDNRRGWINSDGWGTVVTTVVQCNQLGGDMANETANRMNANVVVVIIVVVVR